MAHKFIRKFKSFTRNFFFCIILIAGCTPRQPVPLGHIPPQKPLSQGEEEYGHRVLGELSKQFELDYNDPRLDKLRRIVDRLTKAARADKEPWQVFLFKAPKVKNAAATRGNHIFVWSGILDKLHSEAQLATVLSHEIAHVLAGHTDPNPEQEVKKILINLGAIAAGIAVASQTGDSNIAINASRITTALTQNLGNEFLTNPYSRKLELEADQIGLMIMASAGYDPKAALGFWRSAAKDPTFGSKYSFFSTHPPASERLSNLERAMPLALRRYNMSRNGNYPNSAHTEISKQDAPSPLVPQYVLDKYKGKSKTPQKKGEISLGDSFDFRNNHKQRLWFVKNYKAILYSKPNIKSSAKGEFRPGARIWVVEELGSWVRISEPDVGYLRKQDIKR